MPMFDDPAPEKLNNETEMTDEEMVEALKKLGLSAENAQNAIRFVKKGGGVSNMEDLEAFNDLERIGFIQR